LAHCYPYTYTDVKNYIAHTVTPDLKDRIRKTNLCRSNAGNDIDVMIVTNFTSPQVNISLRPAVILTSRVHPGETQASWMMQGVIDFLIGDDEVA
jgi:cytosolic carboxypeptidase protein 2/3